MARHRDVVAFSVNYRRDLFTVEREQLTRPRPYVLSISRPPQLFAVSQPLPVALLLPLLVENSVDEPATDPVARLFAYPASRRVITGVVRPAEVGRSGSRPRNTDWE